MEEHKNSTMDFKTTVSSEARPSKREKLP